MFVHKTALLSAITTALLASASLQAAEPLKAVGACL